MNYFEADDRCIHCKKLILMEHEIFMFNNSPDAIRLHGEPEWQPSPDEPSIMFDNGPHRVAYKWNGEEDFHPEHNGDPAVQVHEGDLEGLWVPCSAATMQVMPGVWLWICQPMSPKNPCDNDWMRSISS